MLLYKRDYAQPNEPSLGSTVYNKWCRTCAMFFFLGDYVQPWNIATRQILAQLFAKTFNGSKSVYSRIITLESGQTGNGTTTAFGAVFCWLNAYIKNKCRIAKDSANGLETDAIIEPTISTDKSHEKSGYEIKLFVQSEALSYWIELVHDWHREQWTGRACQAFMPPASLTHLLLIWSNYEKENLYHFLDATASFYSGTSKVPESTENVPVQIQIRGSSS